MKGVFNARQHVEELEMLSRGNIAQFLRVTVPLDTKGLIRTTGNPNGEFAVEGNSFAAFARILDKDFQLRASQVSNLPFAFVRFNHPDAPWLPIGLPTGAAGNRFPTSWTLTFGRLWLYSNTNSPGSRLEIFVGKGVQFNSAVTSRGPNSFDSYQPPTWDGLR